MAEVKKENWFVRTWGKVAKYFRELRSELKKYISDVKVIENGVKRSMVITLKTYNGKGVIEGIERVSKPSRRIHCGSKDIPRVRNGQGTVIISTPKGIISGFKAAELNVGGEIICYVW